MTEPTAASSSSKPPSLVRRELTLGEAGVTAHGPMSSHEFMERGASEADLEDLMWEDSDLSSTRQEGLKVPPASTPVSNERAKKKEGEQDGGRRRRFFRGQRSEQESSGGKPEVGAEEDEGRQTTARTRSDGGAK
uniref:Uncharacterized protein n=1 Tax=Pseudictyota dubia TaxID=2749911 RepID=A0A7R9WG29_9STRA|mmetsp:Transcript_4812/g.8355  ORF Transcript_4812/g.8355 Transcript_4812/m.8355 type:complete len:135 (+) Transcript_4812:31-435(+)